VDDGTITFVLVASSCLVSGYQPSQLNLDLAVTGDLRQKVSSSSATGDGIQKPKLGKAMPSEVEGMPHFVVTQYHSENFDTFLKEFGGVDS
jgi:hypothetical protein